MIKQESGEIFYGEGTEEQQSNEQDYANFCESNLEELDYDYIDYNESSDFLLETPKKVKRIKRENGEEKDKKPHKCSFCSASFSKTNHLKRD